MSKLKFNRVVLIKVILYIFNPKAAVGYYRLSRAPSAGRGDAVNHWKENRITNINKTNRNN